MPLSGHEPGKWTRGAAFGLFLAAFAAGGSSAGAATCNVPGTHASIQQAVDDSTCATVQLSARSYPESVDIGRNLTPSGPSTGGAVLDGQLRILGSATAVNLVDLAVENGCSEALVCRDGATLAASGLQVIANSTLPCVQVLFRDGFETGDTAAWSGSTP